MQLTGTVLLFVNKGKTIRNPGKGRGDGGGGCKKFSGRHEIFFSVEAGCRNFFPMWKEYCLHEFLFGKISLAGIFGGNCHPPPPPPRISIGPPLGEQNSFDTTSFLWLEMTRQAMLCS